MCKLQCAKWKSCCVCVHEARLPNNIFSINTYLHAEYTPVTSITCRGMCLLVSAGVALRCVRMCTSYPSSMCSYVYIYVQICAIYVSIYMYVCIVQCSERLHLQVGRQAAAQVRTASATVLAELLHSHTHTHTYEYAQSHTQTHTHKHTGTHIVENECVVTMFGVSVFT